jgi:hypothetical protein
MKTILYVVKIDYKEFLFDNSTSAVEFATTALQSASALLTANTTNIYDIAIELKISDDSENLCETKKGGN